MVVFAETLPGTTTAMKFLPILLLPLLFTRREQAAKGLWFAVSLLLLASVAAVATGWRRREHAATTTADSPGYKLRNGDLDGAVSHALGRQAGNVVPCNR